MSGQLLIGKRPFLSGITKACLGVLVVLFVSSALYLRLSQEDIAVIDVVAVVPADQLTLDPDSGLRIYRNRAFTGIAQTKDASDRVVAIEQFYEGRRHGFVRRWFADGSLAYQSSYKHGLRHGTAQSWWSNGGRRSHTEYKNDQAHGVALRWYKTGELYKRENYVAGRPEGLQQAWRRNGKLFSNFEYRNGRAYGLRNSNLCVELEDEEFKI